jgi:hypothetical protein
MTGEALLAEQVVYSYPLWTFIAFAFAVFGGIIVALDYL